MRWLTETQTLSTATWMPLMVSSTPSHSPPFLTARRTFRDLASIQLACRLGRRLTMVIIIKAFVRCWLGKTTIWPIWTGSTIVTGMYSLDPLTIQKRGARLICHHCRSWRAKLFTWANFFVTATSRKTYNLEWQHPSRKWPTTQVYRTLPLVSLSRLQQIQKAYCHNNNNSKIAIAAAKRHNIKLAAWTPILMWKTRNLWSNSKICSRQRKQSKEIERKSFNIFK